MGKRGPKARNTPAKVQELVEQMFREYRQDGIKPTDYRLMELAGVSSSTLDRWYEGTFEKQYEEKKAKGEATHKDHEALVGYKDAMDDLISYRKSLCTEWLIENPKATGIIFLAKQKRWGGMMDVQTVDKTTKGEMNIRLVGSDGKSMVG